MPPQLPHLAARVPVQPDDRRVVAVTGEVLLDHLRSVLNHLVVHGGVLSSD